MNQQAKDDQSATAQSPKSASPKKRWRVHQRTVAVVFCVVLLPWILVAIPGTRVGVSESLISNAVHVVYGWPFVHLDNSQKTTSRGRLNANFGFLQREVPNSDFHFWPQPGHRVYHVGKPSVELNLRLMRTQRWGESGYWSDLSNWPAWKKGAHFTPRYVGLVLNLIIVALLAGVVAALCEYRIRRHQRLLKFSMMSLLIAMAFLAVCVSCVVQMYRESVAQDALQTLAREGGHALWDIKTDFEPRFPLIVSQLLNHGRHPWGKVGTSRKVKAGKIKVDLDQGSDLDEIKLIAHCVKQTGHSVDVRVFDFSPDRQEMLNVLRGANIVALYLDFDGSDGFGQAANRSRFDVDLEFYKRNLEEIRLNLDRTISPQEQLKPFLGLPSLQWASVANLSSEGVEFILKTKTQWPKATTFGFQDDVPKELCQKLEAEFDETLVGSAF